eukprot:263870-Prorocentrum_lima.AAC.1
MVVLKNAYGNAVLGYVANQRDAFGIVFRFGHLRESEGSMQRVLRCSGMVIEVSVDSEEAQKETGASAEEDAGDPVLRQWLKSYVGTG